MATATTFAPLSTTLGPAATMRLLLARAEALGIEHAWTQCGFLPDGSESPEIDGLAALATLWPEHDDTCECDDCQDLAEAYEVAYLNELDALSDEEDGA